MGETAMNKVNWPEHFQAQGKSGLCIREYCRRHNIKDSHFYAKRKVLSGRPPAPFAEVSVSNDRSGRKLSVTMSISGDGAIEFSGMTDDLRLFQILFGRGG
jgi:hypothetical protein